MLDRRKFLAEIGNWGVSAALAPLLWDLLSGTTSAAEADAPLHSDIKFIDAKYWRPVAGGVQCDLCPRQEILPGGQFGYCKVRRNLDGKMVSYGFDHPCVLNPDPIEKNPLSHVHPGTDVLALAHGGCNLNCLYCQNWQFSQKQPLETKNVKDFNRKDVLPKLAENKLKGVVFTYTEGGVCPEFVLDLAQMARDRKLFTGLCTCGYLMEKPFREIIDPFAAVTITYKGPNEKFYRKICDGSLAPVLKSMEAVKAANKWLEVATLVLPTHNDDPDSLKEMAAWIAKNLGPDTPWHLERFAPMYKLTNLPQTPQTTLELARKIGLDAGLKYVYIDNLAPHEGNHTYCPGCKKALITRLGFKVLKNNLSAGRCPYCQRAIPGIWS